VEHQVNTEVQMYTWGRNLYFLKRIMTTTMKTLQMNHIQNLTR